MQKNYFLTLLFIFLGVAYATAQNQEPMAYMFFSPEATEISVDVGQQLAQPFSVERNSVKVRYLPTGRPVPTPQIEVRPLTNRRRLVIVIARDASDALLPDAVVPTEKDDKVEVEIANVRYSSGAIAERLTITGEIYTSSNIEKLRKATSEALAPEKTTEEKNLFTGFNIALPSKEGAVQGDIVLNRDFSSLPALLQRNLADSGSIGVKIKKGTQDGKDPRHFELGFNLRRTFLRAGEADMNILREAVAGEVRSISNSSPLSALQNVRSTFFRATVLDYGLQMEADLSERGLGRVSNFVFDLRPQLATGAMTAFGTNGHFTFRFMPAGVELGHNISNPDNATKEIGSLARYKAAAEAAVFFEDKSENPTIQRVELNVSSIYRRLLQSETSYNAVTKTNVNTTRGDKLWTQGDFKIFLGPTFGGVRAGLKATYQRGYLPPVFTRTKAFTYGVVFESVK